MTVPKIRAELTSGTFALCIWLAVIAYFLADIAGTLERICESICGVG